MSRFKPMTRFDDAFNLLDRAGTQYRLTAEWNSTFTARVQVGMGKGKASGSAKPSVITIALARALGIEAAS